MRAIVVLVLICACSRGEHRDARVKYNAGVAALAKGDYEVAAKSLLEARSGAGVDPDLRFRAAYDLGLAYAAQADKIRREPNGELAKALELAQQAASWLADASRQRPKDTAAKKNLAIVRARVQAISDELRKGENKIEARIEAAIKEQRGVLDGTREAWVAIKNAGGTDPLAQQGTLTHLADQERGIVADVGAISDLASDEIDATAKKAEDKRTDEEKVRMIQLKNIDLYLQDARGRIAEARRKLQDLGAEDALGKAEAALVALKRAREQLLDPITVLKSIAADELEIVRDTVTAGGDAKTALAPTDPKPIDPTASVEQTPAWLEPAVLADRQAGVRDRLEEVRARLAAAIETPAPPPDGQQPQPKDPQQEKLLERVRTALPSVVTASTEMELAKHSLAESQPKKAIEHERAVLEALSKAIEEFADLKQTIELAYGDQQQIVGLLSPEVAKQIPAADRAKETRASLARNLARMARLQGLIADEVAQLAAQEQQLAAEAAKADGSGANTGSAAKTPPAPNSGAGSGAAPVDEAKAKLDAAKQQLDAEKQRLSRAEALRGEALAILGKLDKALAETKQPVDPVPIANEAKAKIEELRKLFFSVIEHLQQLIRDQGETRDQTSAITNADEFTRAPKLPGLISRQDEHGNMAKAITEALAQQADAMAKNPQAVQQAAQQGGPDAKAFTAAADEVRLAQGAMSDTSTTLVKARDAKQTSESLAPAVKSEGAAIEHLENALRQLQPPPKQQQQDKDKQQQDQQQQQQQQQRQGAGQAARDQDAAQQKKRRAQQSGDDNVEKDW